MADIEDFAGTWKIVKCSAVPFSYEPTGIEGAEFTLESGDVSWRIPENTVHMPFFDCETYEIYSNDPYYLRFYGTFVGHVMEFQVDRPKEDSIQLTYEGWCVLVCEKVSSRRCREGPSVPYSFLCALTEGFLANLIIYAENGTQFKVHKTILSLGNPEIDWNADPCILSGLPEDVLFTTLHYLYAECLPAPLKDDTARQCVQATAHLPGFEDFKKLCQLYLKNNALLDQILNLVEEIHGIGDLIIDYFNGQSISSSTSSSESDSEVNFANNPAKLRYCIIQALRESAVVGAKVLVLCDVFSNRKNELCSAERHELIEYLKSRLPDFMKQVYKLLDVIKLCLGSLSPVERIDIAAYFVSDIERGLDVVFEFATEVKRALEKIINASTVKKEKGDVKENVGQALGRSLKNALHMRELMKLRSFHERVLASFTNLMHKKEIFSNMNSVNKNRSVSKNLEQFIEELPMFMLRTKELTSALEEKLSFKEWKYWFKFGTSKVAWVLSRLSCHRDILDPIISRIDGLVNREAFTQSLQKIGLLTASSLSSSDSSSHQSIEQVECREVKSFHEPPPASESKLALNALSMLKAEINTDMCFHIIFDKHEEEEESHEMKAHCVVIASRCEWFKKALLSGMKESIDKKIIVHDTTPELFTIFLEYLYGGQVDTGQLTTEQLADLMQLSDRYEVDCLKQISEEALKKLVDEDSALFLLGIADQFNARSLRTTALEFIALHKELAKSEVFYDLPDDLQSEVEEMITWVDLRNSQRSEDALFNADSPSSSLLDIEELFSANNLSPNEGEVPGSDSSSLEELTHDSALLEACVAQLRDIVEQEVPREELVRVSLAADYDVNRALNFYFSSS